MCILHSKHTHLWKHSVSSSPNFPVTFSALFSLSLFLFTGFCQHKWAVINPYNINCCSASVLRSHYLCVEWLQSLFMAPLLLIFNLIASSLLFIHFEIEQRFFYSPLASRSQCFLDLLCYLDTHERHSCCLMCYLQIYWAIQEEGNSLP